MEVALLPLLPAILSLASPMVRTRLPVPSLLGLIAAFLMLSPELLMGRLSPVPLTDPEVRIPLAVAMEQYNQERTDSANYYKVLSLRKERYKVGGSVELHLKVEMVKTTCEKKTSWLIYKRFQKCERLPGNQEIQSCTFRLTYRSPKDEMFMLENFCT